MEQAYGTLKRYLHKIKKGELHPCTSQIYLNHFLFILKILKIDTNVKYSILLNNEKFSLFEILKFNICFFKIRFKQLEYAVKGYNKENPRLMNLK